MEPLFHTGLTNVVTKKQQKNINTRQVIQEQTRASPAAFRKPHKQGRKAVPLPAVAPKACGVLKKIFFNKAAICVCVFCFLRGECGLPYQRSGLNMAALYVFYKEC